MSEYDVIVISDDDSPASAQSSSSDSSTSAAGDAGIPMNATARVNVLSSAPLDLTALGILTTPIGKVLMPNRRSYATRDRDREKYSSRTYQANRIKSKTNVAFTTQVIPLNHENPMASNSTANKAVSTNGSISGRPNGADYLNARRASVTTASPNNRLASGRPTATTPKLAKVEEKDDLDIEVLAVHSNSYMIESSGELSYALDSFYDDKKRINAAYICTFNSNCKTAFKDSIEFINHLWSHVTHPYDFDMAEQPNAESAYELKKFVTCPACLTCFVTPCAMQIHYLKCHLKPADVTTVCNICEKDFGKETSLRLHLATHALKDAPYHCQRCSYRTSVRAHLLEHYSREHRNDGSLMCPFCGFTYEFPSNVRKKTVIMAQNFVEHMREHITGYEKCTNCATTLVGNEDIRTHLRKHRALPERYSMTVRPVGNRRPFIQKVQPVNKWQQIDKLQKSYLNSVAGKRLIDIESKVSAERRGVDRSEIGATLHVCSCGKYRTYNGNRMASHFYRCGKQFKQVDQKKISEKKRANDDPAELEEAKMFCVIPPFAGTEVERQKKKIDDVDLATAMEVSATELPPIPVARKIEWNLDARILYTRMMLPHDAAVEKCMDDVDRMDDDDS